MRGVFFFDAGNAFEKMSEFSVSDFAPTRRRYPLEFPFGAAAHRVWL